jgi:putative endonuclease
MKFTQTQKIGSYGEVLAARHLRDKGYEILSANFRTNAGEIDIIAEIDGIICFVEVKSRQAGQMFSPGEAVDIDKENRIKITASHFLAKEKINNDIRFDIIEVVFENDRDFSLNHIEGAF